MRRHRSTLSGLCGCATSETSDAEASACADITSYDQQVNPGGLLVRTDVSEAVHENP